MTKSDEEMKMRPRKALDEKAKIMKTTRIAKIINRINANTWSLISIT